MKTRLHYLALAVAGLLLIPSVVKADDDLSNLFKTDNLADLQTLADGYLKPFGNGFSSGLGNNWYNTAATHKLLGFDLTVGATGAFVPSSDQTFSLSGLKNWTAVNGATTAPTIGSTKDGVQLQDVATHSKKFTTPDGVYNIIPAPTVQLTLGLPFGNDLALRFVPSIKIKEGSGSMFGIGLKHNIKQWIPVVKKLPFDAAIMIGYTKLKVDYRSNKPIIKPSDLQDNDSATPTDESQYQNQGVKLRGNAFMANIIVSKKLAFFTPYFGVGFNSSSFNLDLTGNYPLRGSYNAVTGQYVIQPVANPVSLHYSMTQPGATLGFRLKFLWIFALHAQYTLQKYSTASVGFGLNIR